MREIKFRAWDGEKIIPQTALYWCGEDFVSGLWTNEETHIEHSDQVDVHLMQYTGLKDCNGVEVYEGDILGDDRNECLWLVGFNERGCFIAHDPDNKLDFVLLDDYEFKVLGNIYENPELLESD